MRVSVFRKAHFNAAHRLHNPNWSDAQNRAIFGLCNNPNYHGHNYELEVRVTGEVAADSGFLIDIKILSDLIKDYVETPLDHKNLNLDTPFFATLNPTAENIAIVIWQQLRPHLSADLELHIRLYETPRNFVEYWGE